jgi:hypothetical protein
MTMDQLLLAGAPKLPEGMFYRVTPTGTGSLKVQIRERRKRFGSRAVDDAYTYVYPSEHETSNAAIAAGCDRANNHRIAAVRRRAMYRQAAVSFIGDHDGRKE